MPVTLGQTPDAGFDEPLKLLSDCHRRIEKFLGVLLRVADERPGTALGDEHRAALEAALRYFKTAAPRHTQDEEESLFPRMRKLNDARARAAMAQIDALERDHAHADTHHARVDELGRQWLRDDALPHAEFTRMRDSLATLRDTYRRHIAEEDDVIFPLAGELLTPAQVIDIGREMAERRGLDPGHTGPRCRHARAARPLSTQLHPYPGESP